jgi:methyltransferase family protein
MNDNKYKPRPKGAEVVSKYEDHSHTPHGRLRHDLLYKYYDDFIADKSIDWMFDVGGGSGFLLARLLDRYPHMNGVIIDFDEAMIEQAKINLAAFIENNRVQFILGKTHELPEIMNAFNVSEYKILISCNHALEYIEDKVDSLKMMAKSITKESYLGVMYLNNSHEAYRKIMFKDSPKAVIKQLRSFRLDMVYFGDGMAVDTNELLQTLKGCGLAEIKEYGIRCISDFKSRDFVVNNYDDLMNVEFKVGKRSDFIGLSRYRLKFFSVQ